MNDRIKPAASHAAIIGLTVAVVLAWQFVFPGYYHKIVEEALYTPPYIIQFAESFRQGIFYPRWMPLCFYGYGSPVFIFYSPLLYLTAGLLHLSGLGIPATITLLKLLAVYAGGLSLFYLVREDHTDRAALFAALFYVLLPTSILENYMTNTPAGRLGHAWLPVTLLAARRLVRGPASRGNVALMAVSYAGLVLSHIATAFIFSPFIAAFGIWSVNGGARPKGALRLAFGVGAGLCLSAVLMLPVILERSLVQINLLETLEYMSDWRKPLLLAFDVPANGDLRHIWTLVRYCIFVEAGVGAALFYLLLRNTLFRLGKDGRAGLWLFLAALFMMSSLSAPLWKHLPGLSVINFPARFLSVSLVFASVLLGLLLDAFTRWEGRPKAITAGVVMLIMSVAVFDGLLVFRSIPPVRVEEAEGYFSEVDMVEYLPRAADITTLYGLDGNDPLLSPTDPFFGLKETGPLLSSGDEFSSTISRWGYADRAFTIESPGGARLRVRTFYFPGWRAWVDGAEILIGVEEKTGAMLVDIPPGRHEVELRFANTPVRTAAAAVSVVTLLLLIFPYGALMRPKKVGQTA